MSRVQTATTRAGSAAWLDWVELTPPRLGAFVFLSAFVAGLRRAAPDLGALHHVEVTYGRPGLGRRLALGERTPHPDPSPASARSLNVWTRVISPMYPASRMFWPRRE